MTENKQEANQEPLPFGEENVKQVQEIIANNNLAASVRRHPKTPIKSLDSHLALYGGTAEQVLKCLCMVSKGRPLVVMASGEIKVDMNKLQKVSGMKEIRMARLQELEILFGRKPGGVDPLTVPKNIPTFADKKLFEKEEVVGSAGSPYAGLIIKPKEILKIQTPVVEDLAVDK